MKRFVAMLMLAGGLLMAGGANAANVATITTNDCSNSASYSQTTVNGSVGDTFTINANGNCQSFTSSNTNVLTVANGGNLQANVPLLFTLVGNGTATVIFFGVPRITVTVTAPAPTAQAIPTLSEWTLMLLGLMVISMIGWHFHRERSY